MPYTRPSCESYPRWSGRMIFEVRHDTVGQYNHLMTAWKANKQEVKAYAEKG